MTETVHTIVVDKYLSVNLSIPQTMNALEFMGLLSKVKQILPRTVIEDQVIAPLQHSPTTEFSGLSTRQRVRWTPENKARVIRLREEGKSMKKIADEFRVSSATIYTILSKMKAAGEVQ